MTFGRPGEESARAAPNSRDVLWFWRFIALVATVVVAYIVADIAYVFVGYLTALPQGGAWDESWRTPLRFLVLVAAIGVLVSPVIRRGSDPSFRVASVLSGFFLAAYAALKISGLADPDVPQIWMVQHVVTPLQHWVGLT
jgi:ABC-type multidrug transport system permease subunit